MWMPQGRKKPRIGKRALCHPSQKKQNFSLWHRLKKTRLRNLQNSVSTKNESQTQRERQRDQCPLGAALSGRLSEGPVSSVHWCCVPRTCRLTAPPANPSSWGGVPSKHKLPPASAASETPAEPIQHPCWQATTFTYINAALWEVSILRALTYGQPLGQVLEGRSGSEIRRSPLILCL